MNLRLISTLVFFATANLAAQSQTHNFSVRDDIAMSHFSDPSDAQENLDSNHIKYSPDGQEVAIVTTRGILQSDEFETTLSVFSMGAVKASMNGQTQRAPTRRTLAVVIGRPHGLQLNTSSPLIDGVRWSSDSQNLYFKAMNALGAMQLEEVSVAGAHRRRLTPSNYSVDRFDVRNGTIAYTASKLGQPHPPQGDPINRDALAETGYRIRDILFPGQLSFYPQKFILGVVRKGDDNDTVHKIEGYADTDISAQSFLFPFCLSPDGRELITTLPVSKIPDTWSHYDPEKNYAAFRFNPKDRTLTKPDNAALRPREYVLIDLKTGKTAPLIDGPNGFSLAYALDLNTASWSTDGTRVLVTNVFLPLSPSGISPSTKPCRVASVDLPSLHTRCLFFRSDKSSPYVAHIDAVSFGDNADEVTVSMRAGAVVPLTTKYRLEGDTWKVDQPGTQTDGGTALAVRRRVHGDQKDDVDVSIKQSLNVRPTLWATDEDTGASRRIWDPNPQLDHVRLGEASVYRWKDATGEEWVGGLVKPVGYIPGKRYPLIVQMYMFRQGEFLTDGTDPTAFAAREFASDGFVVLQIQKKPSFLSEAYPQMHLEAYRSAVQNLTEAGMIDPAKVGVVGFSATCWLALYALVHAPHLFAAATIADGFDYNYMQYMLFGPGPPRLTEQENKVMGGDFFGAAKPRWFQEALGFHLDQVQAPVRIEAINPTSVLAEWELYSSLYMQHKPVDLIYFPDGSHVHQRPLERYESQQGNIDWMRFWLQDYEDPDPAKHAQYKRWEEMKSHTQVLPAGVGSR